MENNLEQDIEFQLQVELKRLKKAVEYIEQAKITYTQAQIFFDNTQAKIAEMSELYETIQQAFQTGISEIENKTKNIQIAIDTKFDKRFSSIQQDILNLSNNKSLITEIENIKTESEKKQKLIETNFDKQNFEQNIKIADLTKQIKSSKTFNYILLALWIITLIISVIK